MRIQPRQQLLEVWRAVARSSWVDGRWNWGGRRERNSISDAEQLLCLLGPATDIATFKLDLPNETAEDALDSLSHFGDSVEIPQRLVRVITDYLATYTDETGTPVFPGGSYFSAVSEPGEPTPDQLRLDVVDSFSVAIRLMLATIGFVKVFRTVVRREDLGKEIDTLEAMASKRLSAAMVGLLRSFAVYVFDVGSAEGQSLVRMVNQDGLPIRRVVDDLQNRLKDIKAGLRDVTLGSGQVSDLENPNKLFECGWSWGIVTGAPSVVTTAEMGVQRGGTAQDAPYLYFTVVALDCIQSLFSERTRILGLLDEEQQRLSRSLQLRWDLTQSYWSRIARFGQSRWPLEDMPWRTTDGVQSDYLSLLVSSIVVQELAGRRSPESDAVRVSRVLEELAGRARITRRALEGDPAVLLHSPGYPLDLVGSKAGDGPVLTWRLADFAPQLLKQAIQVAALMRSVETRGPVVNLADQVWEDHMALRQLPDGPAAKLWDQASAVYEELKSSDGLPSWYFTERVVGCLISAADLVASPPLRSPSLTDLASDLLAEADHLFDQELLSVAAEAGPAMGTALHTVRTTLRRAHDVIRERPGTAYVLAGSVLRELDRLAAARQKATGAG